MTNESRTSRDNPQRLEYPCAGVCREYGGGGAVGAGMGFGTVRRRTRVVGSFPDGNSALMLVCARLRHVAGTQWGNKKYMNMKHLEAALEDASIAG